MAQYQAWWTKDGRPVKRGSRVRSIVHRRSHLLLRIRGVRAPADFGRYECGVNETDLYDGTVRSSVSARITLAGSMNIIWH